MRGVADPDNERAEFAIVVRSDIKGKGLGTVLMRKLIDYFKRIEPKTTTDDGVWKLPDVVT